MRHKGIDKEETRQRILRAASCSFRKNGYAGIGVDGLSKMANVTSGAFYAHFGSKDGAFSAALEAGLDEVIEGVSKFQREYGAGWVTAFTEYYLGEKHRDDVENGCAMATLSPEVIRFESEVREIFERKMALIAQTIVQGLSGNTYENRFDRAWAMLGILIGGINIVRAMKNTKMSDGVATAIKAAAIKTAGRTCAAKSKI